MEWDRTLDEDWKTHLLGLLWNGNFGTIMDDGLSYDGRYGFDEWDEDRYERYRLDHFGPLDLEDESGNDAADDAAEDNEDADEVRDGFDEAHVNSGEHYEDHPPVELPGPPEMQAHQDTPRRPLRLNRLPVIYAATILLMQHHHDG